MAQHLNDLHHSELEPYRRLHGAKGAMHPEAGSCFICEGRFLVESALEAARAGHLHVVSVLAEPAMTNWLEPLLPSNSKLFTMDGSLLSELAGFTFHRGVLACVGEPQRVTEGAILAAKRLLVLPRLDDQENLGLLLRSAAALGMDAVLLGKGPGLFDRRTVRVSMGAVWKIPVLRLEDPLCLLEHWKGADDPEVSEIVAAALGEGSQDAHLWRPSERTALVLGPEGPGLERHWLDLCDRQVCISMHRGLDSLNVAAAGAILMFQMCRSSDDGALG